MRSAVIGAFFANDHESRRNYVRAATCLTHIDPRAEFAALAIAEAAAFIIRRQGPKEFLLALPGFGEGNEWHSLCEKVASACASKVTVNEFARSLGLSRGVSGYALHTVPVALYAWLSHPHDFESALTAALDCGGDTDTVGAIVGALAGADVGKTGIPAKWLTRVIEWPRSMQLIEAIADQLAAANATKLAREPVHYFWPGVIFRNVLFLAVVLIHGFRRLLPPYARK